MKPSRAFLKRGFSLIELSLTLVVISSLVVVAVTRYASVEKIKRENRVYEDFNNIKKAIDAYVKVHNYYPCPASPDLERNDPNAGIGARNTADVLDGGGAIIAKAGGCVTTGGAGSSIKTDNSAWENGSDTPLTTSTYEDPDTIDYIAAGSNGGTARLNIGAVPCRELGLPMECGTSPEGDRYTYVVTARLTIPEDCEYYITPGLAVSKLPDPVRVIGAGNGAGIPDPDHFLSGDDVLNCKSDGAIDNTPTMVTDFVPPMDMYYEAHTDTNYTPGDYALIYYGPDGIGAFKDNSTTQHAPNDIGGGAVVDDNKCQNINHRIWTTGNANTYYFLMPRVPFNPDITFGDIVYAGKAETFIPTYCAQCTICGGATAQVVKVPNTTATTPYEYTTDPTDNATLAGNICGSSTVTDVCGNATCSFSCVDLGAACSGRGGGPTASLSDASCLAGTSYYITKSSYYSWCGLVPPGDLADYTMRCTYTTGTGATSTIDY